jgi:acyl transferase domain-containing protein
VIANIFSIQDALLLVARRGAAMQSLEQGGMTAVQLSENDACAYLIDTTLDVAAINSHDSCVFAGLESDLKELEIKLEGKGIAFKRAQVNRAFHSSLTDPCLDVIENATKTVQRRSGTIPVLCNISGAWLSNEDACHPSYWSRHTRASVRFSDCLQTLAQQSDLQWLEIGPAPILSGLVRRNHFLDPIRHVPTFSGKGQQDFLQVLGQLWQSGISLNWAAIRALTGQHHPLRRIPLPTYPFEPKRHWIDPQPVSKTQSFVGTAQSQRAPLSKQEKITEALFTPKWLKTDSTHNACHFSNILFFDPQTEQGDQIIDQLTRLNVAVVSIQNLDELEIIHSREWDAIIYAWPLKH